MLTLMLFRHAKSDWDASFENDHDRPLNKRGRKAAQHMGELLVQLAQLPDAVWTSTAVRARDTARLACEAGAWKCPIHPTEDIYGASHQDLLDLVRQLPSECGRAMLVGHEPTFSSLAQLLIGGGRLRVPTACIVAIRFDCGEWGRVTAGGGQLAWMIPPKLVEGL